MTNSNCIDATRAALNDAAALLEYMRARVAEQQQALDAATTTWTTAAEAQALAYELLLVASLSSYDRTTPEDVTRTRVLMAARAAVRAAL